MQKKCTNKSKAIKTHDTAGVKVQIINLSQCVDTVICEDIVEGDMTIKKL